MKQVQPKFTFGYNRLLHLLGTPRGNPTASLGYMRDTWFPKFTKIKPIVDTNGNFHLDIPRPDGSLSDTLWVAHYDTVDTKGASKVKHMLTTDTFDSLWLDKELTPTGCLGADDGAGVVLLTTMAEHGVPGYYLWTSEEEHGCIGSNAVLKAEPELFKRFQRCICFDRKGTEDIITHQLGTPTCSSEFAKDLADLLCLGHRPSSAGMYTDSNTFSEVIPECTNVAVGYTHAHTTNETLDLQYLERLTVEVLKAADDFDLLKTKRIPDTKPTFKYWGGFTPEEREAWGNYRLNTETPREELMDLCWKNPDLVATIIDQYGLAEEILQTCKEEQRNEELRSLPYV